LFKKGAQKVEVLPFLSPLPLKKPSMKINNDAPQEEKNLETSISFVFV
jgi:hypothetical protein